MTRRASAPAKPNALFGIDAKSIEHDAPEDDEGDEDAGAEGVCVCWISFEFVGALSVRRRKTSATEFKRLR